VQLRAFLVWAPVEELDQRAVVRVWVVPVEVSLLSVVVQVVVRHRLSSLVSVVEPGSRLRAICRWVAHRNLAVVALGVDFC